MNAENYQNILQNYILPAYEALGDKQLSFIQNNCLINRIRSTIEWFDLNRITLTPYPQLSQDLNPFENRLRFL